MFSVNPEIYTTLSLVSRWLFAFFALMLLLFAFAWHHADRKDRRDRFRNLPGAGTVGELVVLSGSSELPQGTWFPVPREGILGSLRSCDLVIPCPGVRSQHLDFSWQDGTGLLVRPRAGCDVLIDGAPVARRGAYADTPLLHGSVLQVGSAVLRLQLFAALSHTNRIFTPQSSDPETEAGAPAFPVQPSLQDPYAAAQPVRTPPQQAFVPVRPLPTQPEAAPSPAQLLPEQVQTLPSQPAPQVQEPVQRPKRADRWKEDWSE